MSATLASRTAPAGAPIIDACELRKSYGDRVALDGVSIAIGRGKLVGLLGPNGAGKTTALSIIAGVLHPDGGTVKIGGHDLAAEPLRARRMLGLAPQSLALYPALTAFENLDFFARIQGLGRREANTMAMGLLDEVGLTERAHEAVAGFSGGMKRRLNLACGMLHHPAALLLDEPTVGVDPQSRERIFRVVKVAAARGAAVLYSTHYMEEAERLCDRVVLIDHGKVVADGTAAELVALAGGEPRIRVVTRDPLKPGWSGDLAGARELPADSNGAGVELVLASLDQVSEVIRRAGERGGEVIEFHVHRPNLQDAFIKLTGHGLRDNAG